MPLLPESHHPLSSNHSKSHTPTKNSRTLFRDILREFFQNFSRSRAMERRSRFHARARSKDESSSRIVMTGSPTTRLAGIVIVDWDGRTRDHAGRLESGTKRNERKEEGAARCHYLDSRRLSATAPPESTCRTKTLERERERRRRSRACLAVPNFPMVDSSRIRSFLAPLSSPHRIVENETAYAYYSPPSSFRERATIDPSRHVRRCPPPPPLPLFFGRATLVREVVKRRQVSRVCGEITGARSNRPRCCPSVALTRQRFTRDDSTAVNRGTLSSLLSAWRVYFCLRCVTR